jgi:hypothetical protein
VCTAEILSLTSAFANKGNTLKVWIPQLVLIVVIELLFKIRNPPAYAPVIVVAPNLYFDVF